MFGTAADAKRWARRIAINPYRRTAPFAGADHIVHAPKHYGRAEIEMDWLRNRGESSSDPLLLFAREIESAVERTRVGRNHRNFARGRIDLDDEAPRAWIGAQRNFDRL